MIYRAVDRRHPAVYRILRFFIIILLEKLVWSTLQNITYCFQIFKFNTLRLVVDYLIEILIAKSKLNIKPVFSPSLFLKYIQNPKLHYITSKLYNDYIIY